ncbi:ABC transporter ATP-binding protein [Clostridium thermobutyricum]|uniref:energy-coupling factor ABC transporter ATP-binding protein n=1 Tax=Clostridium thermobutyricum TaxID=29372 RepID=UPI0029429EB1|nr:ABC transporter ATP-binding protein [Clostridium thermobutyricum]
MIELKNVSFKYKNTLALDDVSLNIKDGESVALIGENGSGKSTLLKLINGIVSPVSGEYIVDNEVITEKRLSDSTFSKKFHKKIGFVFQNSVTQLFCATVFEEIAFGPIQLGMSEEEVEERVNDCLEMLNIEKLRDREPYNLSGGEKKKVAIASVLALNPEVIAFDEPFNEIDPKSKRFLRDLILKLNENGKTIICATHDFEYIEGIFNRAIVFSSENKIIRDGNYEEVISDRDFLRENNII